MISIDRNAVDALARYGIASRGPGGSYEMPFPSEDPKDPTNPRKRPYGYKGVFDPKYASLVYVKFDDGTLTVRHAHFDYDKATIGGVLRRQFGSIASVAGVWDTNHDGYKSEGKNFVDWNFGSQSMIYIYVNNPSGDAFGPNVILEKNIRLDFSQLSAEDNAFRHINNSFLNHTVDETIWAPQSILSIENWYVDETGADIPPHTTQPIDPDKARLYSMNIYLRMRYSNSAPQLVTLILDPDTGNNGSDP